MGSANSTPKNPNSKALKAGLKEALGNDGQLYAFPGDLLYQCRDVHPYNLDRPVKPACITYPRTSAEVSAIVKCAASLSYKVQPRSGGHSYANYCIGGVDGVVVVDLKHFQHFTMDKTTWRATAGAGTLLADITKRMHDNGNRAMAHGTCPQVGLGGHATIGGLGPTSRMWGAALDHIEEIEVVLASGAIVRASTEQNSDVFWACKGAAAGFGIITEFVLRTEPEPGHCVNFSFSFTARPYRNFAETFKTWQRFVSDPKLTRKFTSEVTLSELGMIISGSYFGTKKEYDKMMLEATFPGHNDKKTVMFKDWLGAVGHWAEDVGLKLGGGLAAPIYTKSLTFNNCSLIPDSVIDSVFDHLDKVKKGTLLWFIIFDLEGGAINDTPPHATAYAHRDALYYMQSYAVGIPKLKDKTRDFLRGVHDVILRGMEKEGDHDLGAYAGYVDPELVHPQEMYWRDNLPRLEEIKAKVDPTEVFWNPQSVRPSGISSMDEMVENGHAAAVNGNGHVAVQNGNGRAANVNGNGKEKKRSSVLVKEQKIKIKTDKKRRWFCCFCC